jgi:hypothetical protein
VTQSRQENSAELDQVSVFTFYAAISTRSEPYTLVQFL